MSALNIFMVLEAVSSVSLSHKEDCRCTTCRAALGDKTALAQIMADLEASGAGAAAPTSEGNEQ